MRSFGFILTLTLLFTACNDNNRLCLKGRGDVVSKTVDLPTIHSIDLDVDAEVILTESATQSIQISAQENVIDEVLDHSTVNQGEWRIKIDKSCLIVGEDIRIFININQLKRLNIDGSGEIKSDGRLDNVESLDLEIDGSGTISLRFGAVQDILAAVEGSGTIRLEEGTAENLKVDIDGSGEIDAFSVTAQNCQVDIDGSGEVEVLVSESLIVDIDGSGKVCYRGSPEVDYAIDGSGSISNCN